MQRNRSYELTDKYFYSGSKSRNETSGMSGRNEVSREQEKEQSHFSKLQGMIRSVIQNDVKSLKSNLRMKTSNLEQQV